MPSLQMPLQINYIIPTIDNRINRLLAIHITHFLLMIILIIIKQNIISRKLAKQLDISVFIFDPKYTSYALYDEDGHLVQPRTCFWWDNFFCADTGRACTTPAGTYRIYRKHGEEL